MAAICVDAGTTVIKAVGYDDAGAEAVVVRHETSVSRPAARPGRAGHGRGLGRGRPHGARRRRRARAGVDFVAVTAQGDGCWLVDAAGEPDRPGDPVERRQGGGHGRRLDPVRAGRARLPDQRLLGRLRAAARHPHLAEGARPRPAGALGGQPHLRRVDLLPADRRARRRRVRRLGPVHGPARPPLLRRAAGAVRPRLGRPAAARAARRRTPGGRADRGAATLLGLPAGTPVVMSPYDIASTALGVGAVRTGQACSHPRHHALHREPRRAADLGTASRSAITIGAAGRRTCAPSPPSPAPRSSSGPAACSAWPTRPSWASWPTLSAPGRAAGCRSSRTSPRPGSGPPSSTRSPGAPSSGMSFEHGREHVARAVLEGLTLVIQDCLAASGGRRASCGSAAAARPARCGCQLIADVTGLPVLRSADSRGRRQGRLPGRPGRHRRRRERHAPPPTHHRTAARDRRRFPPPGPLRHGLPGLSGPARDRLPVRGPLLAEIGGVVHERLDRHRPRHQSVRAMAVDGQRAGARRGRPRR